MKTRWISMLLCVVLALGLLPAAALAAEEAEDVLPLELSESADMQTPAQEGTETAASDAEETSLGDSAQSAEEAEAPAERPEEDEAPADGGETPFTDADEAVTSGRETPEPIAEGTVEAEEPAVRPETWSEDPEAPQDEVMGLALDGASTKTFSSYSPRSVKSGETLHRGIDVSNWQGSINWSKVKAAGVEFVIIRGAYRGTSTGTLAKDGRFDEYIKGAKAAGLKVGAYVFSQAITTAEAQAEADYLLKVVKGYSLDLPLVFDLEHYSGGRFTKANLSRRAKTDLCKAFCARVEAAGYESMVYSNPSMLNYELYAGELGRLWLAHFTTRTSYSGHAYEYWQCGVGTVDGIDGDVDLDFWFEPARQTPTPVSTGPFTDVKEGDWFYATVMKAYEGKIVSGMGDGTFDPMGSATRGQVVTMMYRVAGTPAWTQEAVFEDLTQDYYKDAIFWAAENGIASGVAETSFAPEDAITREQLVTFLYRMAGSPETAQTLDGFKDAESVHSYAVDAMAWAVENKIVSGYEDATLRPRVNANRAEVCAILMRYDALPKDAG